MKLANGTKLSYHVTEESWYARMPSPGRGGLQPEHPEVFIGAYHPDGSATWEFAVRDHVWRGGGHALRLEMFSDSWAALREMPEFFEALSGSDPPSTLDDVKALLDSLGAVDTTERIAPAGTCDGLRRLADQLEGIGVSS